MNPNIIQPDSDRYERFSSRHKPGNVCIAECDICGYLQWRSTRLKEPDGYTIENLSDCPACQYTLSRTPELFRWVINVVIKSQKDMAKPVAAIASQKGLT